VNLKVPSFLKRGRGAGFRRRVVLGLLVGCLGEAAAHDLYTAYIQHSVQVNVSARHVDLTVDLTFFEEWSARERRIMDANTNGLITRAEVQQYVKTLAPLITKQVRLSVAGKDLPLVLLYEPEVDLLGSDKAGPAHHRLRLCLFTSTPPGLQAGDSIRIEDELWPEAKALSTLQAGGSDGCRLEPEKPGSFAAAPAGSDKMPVFTVKCLQPPAAAPLAAPGVVRSTPENTSRP
jgi:hypothetical protein